METHVLGTRWQMAKQQLQIIANGPSVLKVVRRPNP